MTSVVTLGEIVDLKLMLYQGMVWSGMTQAGLAKRLGTSPTLVSRLLDLDHVSKAEQIRAAMHAIGVPPMIRFDPKSSMPPRARRVEAGFTFYESSRALRGKADEREAVGLRLVAGRDNISGVDIHPGGRHAIHSRSSGRVRPGRSAMSSVAVPLPPAVI